MHQRVAPQGCPSLIISKTLHQSILNKPLPYFPSLSPAHPLIPMARQTLNNFPPWLLPQVD